MRMNKSIQLVPGVTPHQVKQQDGEQLKPCSVSHFIQFIEDRTLKCIWETGDTVCFKCANGDQWLIARELTSSRMQYKSVGEEQLRGRLATHG